MQGAKPTLIVFTLHRYFAVFLVNGDTDRQLPFQLALRAFHRDFSIIPDVD
jgi:hypothetical protein